MGVTGDETELVVDKFYTDVDGGVWVIGKAKDGVPWVILSDDIDPLQYTRIPNLKKGKK